MEPTWIRYFDYYIKLPASLYEAAGLQQTSATPSEGTASKLLSLNLICKQELSPYPLDFTFALL